MTEEWRDIAGYGGLYQVSSCGRVRSLTRVTTSSAGWSRVSRGRILKRTPRDDGYLQVSLWENGARFNGLIHQLVAKAFIGPRPFGLEVCHNNGDKSDCAASNIRYDTPVGNNRDKIKHGTNYGRDTSGEKNGRSVLNAGQVARIRSMVAAGKKRQAVARLFGVSYSLVKGIVRREIWAHV